jgi:hypothetical protein
MNSVCSAQLHEGPRNTVPLLIINLDDDGLSQRRPNLPDLFTTAGLDHGSAECGGL